MDQRKRHIGSMNLKKNVQGWIKEKDTSELVGKKTRSMINEFTAVASCTVVMMSQWNEMENIGCY